MLVSRLSILLFSCLGSAYHRLEIRATHVNHVHLLVRKQKIGRNYKIRNSRKDIALINMCSPNFFVSIATGMIL